MYAGAPMIIARSCAASAAVGAVGVAPRSAESTAFRRPLHERVEAPLV